MDFLPPTTFDPNICARGRLREYGPTKGLELVKRTIRKEMSCDVGWSDHTVNPGVIYRAINKWNAKVIEFHLDLDAKGEEYHTGHCWLPNEIECVIKNVRDGEKSDGNGVKEPVQSEISDRMWRTDKSDGLRPFKSIRKSFNSEAN